MRSVADELREEQRRKMASMTPSERVALAMRLGEETLQFMMSAQNIDRAEALRRIRRSRRAGRKPSRCHDEK